MSFDSNYFDEEFYKRQTGQKGAKRNQNSPFYMEFAAKLKAAFPIHDLSLLDIGCGMGWRTLNHFRNHFSAYGCDVSDWAYFNSVLPAGRHYCCDVRELSKRINRKFNIVNLERIVEYLPVQDARRIIEAVDHVAQDYVVAAIICSDHQDPQVVENARPGRLNINTKEFWESLAAERGWVKDEEKTAIMVSGGWDCIWVFRKPNTKLLIG